MIPKVVNKIEKIDEINQFIVSKSLNKFIEESISSRLLVYLESDSINESLHPTNHLTR